MAKGISINFLANARDFLRGTKEVEGAFEDVAGSLDELAADAQRKGRDLGDDLGDGAKRGEAEASAALEKVERSFEELAATAKRETAEAGAATDRNLGRGSSSAKASMNEVKQEALANASETFSSFDGSAQSFVSGIQGTFGGLVASLGPQGAIAAALGAIGIGFVIKGLEISEEAKAELREQASEITNDFIDAGTAGERTAEQWVDAVRQLATETDDSKVNLIKLGQYADRLGMSLESVVAGYVDGGSALDDQIKKTGELIDASRAADAAKAGPEGAYKSGYTGDLEKQMELLQRQSAAIDQAELAQRLYNQSGARQIDEKNQKTEESTNLLQGNLDVQAAFELAQSRTASAVDAVNASFDAAASSIDKYTNKKDKSVDVDAYIADMERIAEAVEDYQEQVGASELSESAKAFLASQGTDAAARWFDAYQSSSESKQKKLNKIWTEAGRDDSAAYVDAMTGGIAGMKRIQVPPLDLSSTEAEIKAFLEKDRTIQITLAGKSKNGQRVF